MRRAITIIALSLLLALMCANGFAGGAPVLISSTTIQCTETSLGMKEDKVAPIEVMTSPDARHVAFVTHSESERYVVVDGVKGKTYPWIPREDLQFSPDSKHVAYWASTGEDDWFVVTGKKEGKHYGYKGPLVISPDSKHVAYSAFNNDIQRRVVVAGGVEGKGYSDTTCITYSPDSKRLAYAGETREKRHADNWNVVVDGTEGKDYGHILAILFSPDSARVAYAASRWDADAAKTRYLVVVDGKEEKEYDGVAWNSLVFSPDSKRLAYAAKRGEKWLVVVDGNEGKEYDMVGREKGLGISPFASEKAEFDEIDKGHVVVFSADSKRYEYIGKRGEKLVVVIDGTEGKEYDALRGFVFSPDSQHYAYAAKIGKKRRLVSDGEDGKEYDDVHAPVYSPDSQKLASAAEIEGGKKAFIVANGKENEMYDLITNGPFFSPDSKRVAFVTGGTGHQRAVVDGTKGEKEYFWVNDIAFSPDSQHYAFQGQLPGIKHVFVVDGTETEQQYDFIPYCHPPLPYWDGPTKLHALGMRGKEFFLVEIEIKE